VETALLVEGRKHQLVVQVEAAPCSVGAISVVVASDVVLIDSVAAESIDVPRHRAGALARAAVGPGSQAEFIGLVEDEVVGPDALTSAARFEAVAGLLLFDSAAHFAAEAGFGLRTGGLRLAALIEVAPDQPAGTAPGFGAFAVTERRGGLKGQLGLTLRVWEGHLEAGACQRTLSGPTFKDTTVLIWVGGGLGYRADVGVGSIVVRGVLRSYSLDADRTWNGQLLAPAVTWTAGVAVQVSLGESP
jgi:hypothetical protein